MSPELIEVFELLEKSAEEFRREYERPDMQYRMLAIAQNAAPVAVALNPGLVSGWLVRL